MTVLSQIGTRIGSALAISVAVTLALRPLAFADGITVTRNCEDPNDPRCVVQVSPASAVSVAAVNGPSTALGPAIELNMAITQLADAGSAVPAKPNGGSDTGGSGPPAQSSGAAVNGFQVSVGQTGTATATSGTASSGSTTVQAGGSSASQNASSQDTGGDQSTPPTGGSGINMITNIASILQIVQVVARGNNNTTIAPVQLAEQCQQAAVSCSGAAPSHP